MSRRIPSSWAGEILSVSSRSTARASLHALPGSLARGDSRRFFRHPVWATAIGAFFGAVANFLIGRFWSFEATHRRPHGQALRYALVSAGSLGLNSLGVLGLYSGLGIHYVIAKAATALAVGVLYNFPLHRRFVFR
jgi:putative flippase GtrA